MLLVLWLNFHLVPTCINKILIFLYSKVGQVEKENIYFLRESWAWYLSRCSPTTWLCSGALCFVKSACWKTLCRGCNVDCPRNLAKSVTVEWTTHGFLLSVSRKLCIMIRTHHFSILWVALAFSESNTCILVFIIYYSLCDIFQCLMGYISWHLYCLCGAYTIILHLVLYLYNNKHGFGKCLFWRAIDS